MRLLNALYLQAGLMVSRTHPAAASEGCGEHQPQVAGRCAFTPAQRGANDA